MSGYLHFDATGSPGIDKILHEIEMAGSSFHHTDQWGEEQDWMGNKSHTQLIQEAANEAAKEMIRRAPSQPAPVVTEEMVERAYTAYDTIPFSGGDGWVAYKMAAMRAALTAALGVTGWVSVKERLPLAEQIGDGETYTCSARVLVWYPALEQGPVTAFYHHGGGKRNEWCDDESMGPMAAHCQPTHWQPLPPAPGGGGEVKP